MVTKTVLEEELEDMTVEQLRAFAREKKIRRGGTWIVSAGRDALKRAIMTAVSDKGEMDKLYDSLDDMMNAFSKVLLDRLFEDPRFVKALKGGK